MKKNSIVNSISPNNNAVHETGGFINHDLLLINSSKHIQEVMTEFLQKLRWQVFLLMLQ